MRVLVSANGPHVKTGYGIPCLHLAQGLKAMGHEVAVYAWYGLTGGAIQAAGLTLFPRLGAPLHGQDADRVAAYWKADVVITIEDIWVLPPDFAGRLQAAGVKAWIPWFPVDGVPAAPAIVQRANSANIPAVYSRFGERELCEAGVANARYVPLGVDCSVYRPLNRQEVRGRHNTPAGSFVVTMIAANKGWPCRKSFPEALEAFGRFHLRHPEAVLYLHTEEDSPVGINLPVLIDRLGIPREAVQFVNQMDYALGLSAEHMAEIYNITDVLLAPSMGEGFGLPIVEAQACGTPVITQDCSSMPELTVNGTAIKPLQRFYQPDPLGQWQYTASIDAIDGALEEAYRRPQWERGGMAARGIEVVRRAYDWPVILENYWRPIMEEVEAQL